MGTNRLERAKFSQELELLHLTLKKVRYIGSRGFEHISSCFTVQHLDVKCLLSVLVTLFSPRCFKNSRFSVKDQLGYLLVFLTQGLL